MKREISRLEQQRDHDYNDYNSLEGAYDDLYQRFLKLRESSEDIHKASGPLHCVSVCITCHAGKPSQGAEHKQTGGECSARQGQLCLLQPAVRGQH